MSCSAQHLVRQGVEDISPGKLRYMISSGRLALLFDGFDELELRVGYDNAADYLQMLLESVTEEAKVVLTSRTQHFRSTDQVRTALGDRVATLAGSRVVGARGLLRRADPAVPDQPLRRRRGPRAGPVRPAPATSGTCSAWRATRGCSRSSRTWMKNGCAACRTRAGQISAAGLYREIIDFWLGRARRRGTPPARPAVPG